MWDGRGQQGHCNPSEAALTASAADAEAPASSSAAAEWERMRLSAAQTLSDAAADGSLEEALRDYRAERQEPR